MGSENNFLDGVDLLADLCIAIGRVGEPLTGKWGHRTDVIGQIGEELSQGKDLGTILSSDDTAREVAGIIGAAIGGTLGAYAGGSIGSGLGALGGGFLSGNPMGAIFGYIVGGAVGTAYLGNEGSDIGEDAGKGIYDFFNNLPDQDNLTDAQRAELAAMLTGGGMPWDYNPNGEEVNPLDLLDDLGKELGKLLDMLPDDLVPDFLDGLLGGLDDIFPNGLLPYLLDLFPVELDPFINVPWREALNWVAPRDPLILDLDGDGIETIAISDEKHILFDSNGDGVRTATGWVKGDDGLLVLDRNGNGTIDNGGELFGDQTLVNGKKATNGFEALRAEDTNGDGKFDANDTNFSNVKVWRDMDGDGVSDAGELFTLNELGIASINLSSSSVSTTNNTNTITATSTFTKTDGTTGKVANLNFTTNNFYSEFTDKIELDNTAMSMPNLSGSGMVRDIQEASTLSEGLTDTIQTLQSQGYVTKDKFMGQLDEMISNWADTSDMQTSVELARSILGKELVYLPNLSLDDLRLYIFGITLSSGSSDMHSDNTVTITFATAEEESQFEKMEHIREEAERLTKLIEILERFNGHNFVDIKPEESKPVSFGDTKILDGATITRTTTAASDGGSSSGSGYILPEIPMIVMLDASQIANLEKSYETLKESMYNGFALQSRLKSYINAIELTLDENGFGLDMSSVIDKLNMLALNNLKNALIDWDELMHFGGAKFDVIDDNATLSLHEWVSKIANNPEMMNELQALNGLELADGTLVVGSNDVDNIDTGYVSGTHVVFSGNGDDNIIIRAYDATIYTGSGNDTITTAFGNDTVHGGDGNDVINANSGNDIIVGGKGDDIINGSYGSDTYIFSRGDGKDIIKELHSTGDIDTLQFTDGITASDIVAKVDGNNFILAIKEDGKTWDELSDKIILENWFTSATYRIENITFADGTILSTMDDILGLFVTDVDDVIKSTELALNIDAGSGNDTIIIVNSVSNTIYGGNGNDTIASGTGSDTMYGDSGNDVIKGSGGNDVLNGGIGDDLLQGGNDDDTYIFGSNSGKDTIYDKYDDYAYRYYNAGNDTIKFTDGITASDIVAKIDGNNLILAIKEDGKTFDELSNKITIQDWYNSYNRIENIVFDDGTTLNTADMILSLLATDDNDIIKSTEKALTLDAKGGDDVITVSNNLVNTIHGGDGNDTINSSSGTNTIYGDGGNDTIATGSGNDTIYGGDGNDVINANSGNDIIIGGKGNDILNGSYGSDTYIFNRGDGKDIIREYDHWVRGTDVLIFGENISIDDIVAKVDGNNLILAIKEDGKTFDELVNKITIENWYKDFYSVEEIQFDDGTKLTMFNDIISLLSTNGDDIIKGYNSQNNIIDGKDGNDTISIASNLSNIVHGGSGNDTINSSLGTNTIYGDNGNDTITTGSGNDTIYGGDGNDVVTTGSGADIVVLNSVEGYDSVLDFNVSQDKFQLDSTIFESLVDLQGVLSVDNISFGANKTVANDENDFIIYNQTNGNIFYDADGSGSLYTAILIADVTNNLALNNTQFAVI